MHVQNKTYVNFVYLEPAQLVDSTQIKTNAVLVYGHVLHYMVILNEVKWSQNKKKDFLMILAWLSP